MLLGGEKRRLGVAWVLLIDIFDDMLVIVFATGQVSPTNRWQKPRERKQ